MQASFRVLFKYFSLCIRTWIEDWHDTRVRKSCNVLVLSQSSSFGYGTPVRFTASLPAIQRFYSPIKPFTRPTVPVIGVNLFIEVSRANNSIVPYCNVDANRFEHYVCIMYTGTPTILQIYIKNNRKCLLNIIYTLRSSFWHMIDYLQNWTMFKIRIIQNWNNTERLYLLCESYKLLKCNKTSGRPHFVHNRPRGALSKSDRNNYIRAECGRSIHLSKRLNKIYVRDKILSMKNILFVLWNSEHLIKHGIQIKPFQSVQNLIFKM